MSMAKVKGTYEVCVCVGEGGRGGRIMDKWVVRRWDAHRTDCCRTCASSDATQRYSYERVPRFAGRFVVRWIRNTAEIRVRILYLSVQIDREYAWIQTRLGRECSRKTFCLCTLKRRCTFTRPRQRIPEYFFENFRRDWNFVLQIVMNSHFMVIIVRIVYSSFAGTRYVNGLNAF